MIKWIVLAVAAYILYRLFANDLFKKRQKEEKVDEKEMERKVKAGEMVKDPVCGAYVSVDDSITVRDGATTHHFCSYDCREKFLKRLEEGGRELPD
ncbi:MAG: transcriptional regulator, partial [Desulfovibrionaceae bacterium]|nr:transcriptional regulator [Desulfovibrionaceae bacterium]